jgi:cytochrome c biogenesis protein CcmG, thiol:disulfide interchange protein DsbE
MRFRLTTWSLWSLLILATGAAWIFISAAAPGTTSGGRIPAPQVGFLAPEISLPTAEGGSVSLSELRGKPVLVNFWASWCPPCRSEMPAMQQLYRELRDQGVVILAVNAANQDDRAAAQEFTRSLGLDFPIVFDLGGQAAGSYAVRSLPSSYFIDPDGVIREIVIGGMSEASLRIRLRKLLGFATGASPP